MLTTRRISVRNLIQPGNSLNSLMIAVPRTTVAFTGQVVMVGALIGDAAVDGVWDTIIKAQNLGRL